MFLISFLRFHVSVRLQWRLLIDNGVMNAAAQREVALPEMLHKKIARSRPQSVVYTSRRRTCVAALALIAAIAFTSAAFRVLNDVKPLLSSFMPDSQRSDPVDGAGSDVPSYRVRGWLDRIAGSAASTRGSSEGVVGSVRALVLTTAAAPPALAGRLLLSAGSIGSSAGATLNGSSELVNASNNALAASGVVALTTLARIAGVTGPLPPASATTAAAGAGALPRGSSASRSGVSADVDRATGALVPATALVERLRPAGPGPALTSAYVCTRDTAAAALDDLRHNQLFRQWARSTAGAGAGEDAGEDRSERSDGRGEGRKMSFTLFGIPVAAFGHGGLPAAWAGALLAAALAFFAYAAALEAAAWLLTRTAIAAGTVWLVAQLAWHTGNMRRRAPLGHVLRLALLTAAPMLLWLQLLDPLLPRHGGGAGESSAAHDGVDDDAEQAAAAGNAAAAAAAAGGGLGAAGVLFRSLRSGLQSPYVQCGVLVLALLILVAHVYDHGNDADAAAAARAALAARGQLRHVAAPASMPIAAAPPGNAVPVAGLATTRPAGSAEGRPGEPVSVAAAAPAKEHSGKQQERHVLASTGIDALVSDAEDAAATRSARRAPGSKCRTARAHSEDEHSTSSGDEVCRQSAGFHSARLHHRDHGRSSRYDRRRRGRSGSAESSGCSDAHRRTTHHERRRSLSGSSDGGRAAKTRNVRSDASHPSTRSAKKTATVNSAVLQQLALLQQFHTQVQVQYHNLVAAQLAALQLQQRQSALYWQLRSGAAPTAAPRSEIAAKSHSSLAQSGGQQSSDSGSGPVARSVTTEPRA